MAKATALCTCRVCGTKFKKEKMCYDRKQATDWENWALKNYDLCTKCWREQQNQILRENGAHYDTFLFLYGIIGTQYKADLALVFDKNSYGLKDKLKEAGAEYIDGRWVVFCSFDDYEETIKRLSHIPAIKDSDPPEKDILFFKSLRRKKNETLKIIEAERIDKISKIEKVILPDKLSSIQNGAFWNGKIYGEPDAWIIFLNDDHVSLSNREKEDLVRWQRNKTLIKSINNESQEKIAALNEEIYQDIAEFRKCNLMQSWLIDDEINNLNKPYYYKKKN